MKRIFAALAISGSLLLGACGEQSATAAIEAMGFTNVRLGGIPWFSCGEHDSAFYNTSFTATGVNGKPVSGAACGGLFKGWTIRILGGA